MAEKRRKMGLRPSVAITIIIKCEIYFMEPKRNAFTLVELLVVISIIALLLSILMPALSKVREQARTVICQSRKSQWGQYLYLYAHDNDDAITYVADKDLKSFWYDTLGRYITEKKTNIGSVQDATDASLKAAFLDSNYYLKARECPSMTINNPVYIGTNADSEAYWRAPPCAPFIWEVNVTWPAPGGPNPPIKLSSLQTPGLTFGFIDVVSYFFFSPFQPYFRFVADYDHDDMDDSIFKVANNPIYLSYNGARPRMHSDGTTLWMFDGHTEYIKFRKFWEPDKNGIPMHPFWKFRIGK